MTDDENIAMEMLRNDFVVKIPPKRKYKIRAFVVSCKKGEPKIVIEGGQNER